MSIIEIKNVPFPNNNCNKEISISIERGSYTTIIGKNGSGKSTLLKLITGLIEYDKGEIIVSDIVMNHKNKESIYNIRKLMGVLFQNPEYQLIGRTVEQNIAFGLENINKSNDDMNTLIREYSKKFDIDAILKKSTLNLSGGEQQKVALVSAIITNPSIIILDEFTSMLDNKSKANITRILNELKDLESITIISITHDIDEILNSDNVILLDNKELIFQGIPLEILSVLEELCL